MQLLRSATAVLAATLLMGASPLPYPGHPATTPDINGADILARDKAISDDAFEGRGPGTEKGEAAAEWIAQELKRIGIAPGRNRLVSLGFTPWPTSGATLRGNVQVAVWVASAVRVAHNHYPA